MRKSETHKQTVKGLIIRETTTFETSRMVSVLTDNGIIHASAANSRKHASPMFAGSALFCYSDITYSSYQQQEVCKMSSCTLINNFYNLRNDIINLSLANYYCALIQELAHDDTSETLRLALNTLHTLCVTGAALKTKPCFEIRLLALNGFALNLINCVKCGNNQDISGISIPAGGSVCHVCGGGEDMSAACAEAVRYAFECDMKRLYSFEIKDEVLDEFTGFAERYMLYHVERVIKPLSYLKRIVGGLAF